MTAQRWFGVSMLLALLLAGRVSNAQVLTGTLLGTVKDESGIAESISVEAGTIVDQQRTGFASRFGQEALSAIPVRRFSMFDLIRATPGVSPTSVSPCHNNEERAG